VTPHIRVHLLARSRPACIRGHVDKRTQIRQKYDYRPEQTEAQLYNILRDNNTFKSILTNCITVYIMDMYKSDSDEVVSASNKRNTKCNDHISSLSPNKPRLTTTVQVYAV
jgi:hypothetical protein